MKSISLMNADKWKSALFSEGGSSPLPDEGLIPRKGTMQAALRGAESLPDISDADFDDLEESLFDRQ